MKFFEFRKIWNLSSNDFISKWKKIDTDKKIKIALSFYIFSAFSFFSGFIVEFWMFLPFLLGIVHTLMYFIQEIMEEDSAP